MSVGSNEKRTARKPHKCEECRREIPKGATYHHISSLFDGHWWSVDICARCQRAWDRANDCGALEGCDEENGPSYGHLAEWLKEWRSEVWRDGKKHTPLEIVRKRRERRAYFAAMHTARREAR